MAVEQRPCVGQGLSWVGDRVPGATRACPAGKQRRSGVAQLARFARKLRRHAVGILNYFDFPISTAKVEGINSRIKVIKRRAYGYRDLDYFKLKIYNIHTTRYSLA